MIIQRKCYKQTDKSILEIQGGIITVEMLSIFLFNL